MLMGKEVQMLCFSGVGEAMSEAINGGWSFCFGVGGYYVYYDGEPAKRVRW